MFHMLSCFDLVPGENTLDFNHAFVEEMKQNDIEVFLENFEKQEASQ